MVESIKELRKICQNPLHTYQGFFRKRIWRVPSIYITKLLLYTPITANHVTMFMIFLGFVIAYLFSIGSYWYFITGALLLEFVYLLDGVDGEIARYRKQPSIIGVFLDLILHVANVAVPFIGLTIGLYKLNPNLEIVVFGLSATLFSLASMDMQPLKHHAFFMELIKYAKKEKKYNPEIKKEIKQGENKKRRSLAQIIFADIINPFYDNFLMNKMILLAAIFNKLHWFLIFYGLTYPIIWLIKLFHEYRSGYSGYEYLLEPYKK